MGFGGFFEAKFIDTFLSGVKVSIVDFTGGFDKWNYKQNEI